MQIIIITGISGSGKSVALAALEDLGFFCVDNLPAQLLPELVGMEQTRGLKKMAVAMDSRSGSHTEEVLLQLGALKRIAAQTRIVFLTANTPTLIARFSETRRRHPLNMPDVAHALNVVPTDRSLTECIELERDLLAPLAELGMVLDTSDVTAPVLRSWLKEFVHSTQGHLQDNNVLLTFVSFAFKQGVPLDADLVFDVRCLPNPYYEPFMRKLTGLDSAVAEYLSLSDKVNTMLEDIADFV
ncbi:MAG: RNase adapter RapZ, partial [Burkholderiaceae bacterium]|nr:RNase adapter RapZ [Burkholderiaceae bacterium]